MKRQTLSGLLVAGLLLTASQVVAFSLTDTLKKGIDKASDYASRAYDTAKEYAGKAYEGAKSIYGSAKEALGPVYDSLSQAAKDKLNKEWDRLKNMDPEKKKALVEKLKSAAKSGLDVTKTLATAVAQYESTPEGKKALMDAAIGAGKTGLSTGKDVYGAYKGN